MPVIRFIGALFLMLAVIALTADLSAGPSPASAQPDRGRGATSFATLHQHWRKLAPVSLNAVRKSVETRVHPLLWSGVIRPILDIPAFISLGAIALLLFHLGRPRRRVEIFEN
ncbi:MAG: hypothetical protein AB7O43_05165 [Hyphomicrobiaceae bacterium]